MHLVLYRRDQLLVLLELQRSLELDDLHRRKLLRLDDRFLPHGRAEGHVVGT